MNETLTFVLQLKEMMSGGMAKIASTAQSVFSGVDKRIANTQKQFSMAGRSITDLNNRLALLTQKRDLSIGSGDIARANREIQQLEHRIDRLNNKGRTNTSGGGMRLPWWLTGAAIGGMAAMAGVGMIKEGANQQRDIVGLTTFMGKQGANSFYSNVQQEARLTPFVTHDLMMADRMLISTGMSARRAQTDIHNLANAVAATGGSNYALERMAQHLQMIKSMGHASYLQLKEFTTNGINIMQLLSDATGKHIKMSHGMTVSYEAIEKALAHAADKGGLFYNALFAQSQTIWGKWSTLVDDLQISAGKIVASQSEGITGLLDLFDTYAQRLPEMADQYAGAITSIAKAVIGFVGTLMSLAKWIYHNWNWLKYIVGAIVVFKVAMWAAAGIISIYNTVMSLAAIRTTLLAVAEGEATLATIALDAALMALPWMLVAAGITAAAVGIAHLVNESEDAKKRIDKNLSPKAKHYEDITNIAAGNSKIEAQRATTKARNMLGDVAEWQQHIKDPRIDTTGGMHPFVNLRKNALPIMMEPGSNTRTPTAAELIAKKTKEMAADANGFEGDGIEEKNAITGGGHKQVIVNINHALLEIKEQIFNNVAGGVADIEQRMDEAILRVVQSMNAVQ